MRDAAAVRQWVLAPARVDYLFNNAGIAGVGGLTDRYAPSDWETIIDVNLKGIVNGVHAAYSVMLRQGFGHIVNTASLAGLIPFPVALPYSTVKHAVVGLSKSLRIEAATKGVRVSVLCPGVIRTPMLTSDAWRGYEQVSVERKLKWWEQFKPIDPEPWARETLDRVARNEAVIIVPRTAGLRPLCFGGFPGKPSGLPAGTWLAPFSCFPSWSRHRAWEKRRARNPASPRSPEYDEGSRTASTRLTSCCGILPQNEDTMGTRDGGFSDGACRC